MGWIICGPWYLSFAYCRIGVSSFIVKVYLICIMNFLFAKKTSKWVCPARYLYTFAQANIYKLRKNENNFFLIYKYRVFYLLIFRIISFFLFAAFKSSKRMRYHLTTDCIFSCICRKLIWNVLKKRILRFCKIGISFFAYMHIGEIILYVSDIFCNIKERDDLMVLHHFLYLKNR